MKDSAIKNIIEYFENKGYNFYTKRGIEFFGRKGDWQTKTIANKIEKIKVLEVNKDYHQKLIDNLPSSANVKICDAIKEIDVIEEKFDIVLLDNPMNCFGNNSQYCEHFDILPKVKKVMENDVLIVFNTKTKPFNYEENFLWKKRRNKFYNVNDASSLTLVFLEKFYIEFFQSKFNYNTLDKKIEKRPQEKGLYQFAFLLTKRNREVTNDEFYKNSN